MFWKLYAFFFAVPFPMLLYYNIKYESGLPVDYSATNPWLSLGLILLSIILWLVLLAGYYRSWILQPFIIKRNIGQLVKNGEHREATILDVQKLDCIRKGYDSYKLNLSFRNLVGTEITQRTSVNDGRPDERRFEAGKKIDIVIDKEVSRIPYFIFATSEAEINKKIILLLNLGWLALLAVITGYYSFSYWLESEGMGWRFMAWEHPLLLCPAIILGYRLLIGGILGRFAGTPTDSALIKLKGIETTAKLLKASQTGTYINEQPMINFELEFVDYRNRGHRVSLKKIVDLLDLESTRKDSVSIFYLKDDPQRIAFTSDLNEIE